MQGIYAYCTLNDGVEYTDGLKKELVMAVREQIGAFAAPDVIHWAPGESVWQAVKPVLYLPFSNVDSCGKVLPLPFCHMLCCVDPSNLQLASVKQLIQCAMGSSNGVCCVSQRCQRRDQARSCGACCARLLRERRIHSATRPHWQIQGWWTSCSAYAHHSKPDCCPSQLSNSAPMPIRYTNGMCAERTP